MTDMERLISASAMLEREKLSLEEGLDSLRWASAEREMRMRRLRPAAALLCAVVLLFTGGLIGYGMTRMPTEPEVIEIPKTDGPPVDVTIPTPYEVEIPKPDGDLEIAIPKYDVDQEVYLGEFRFEGLEREIGDPEDVSMEALMPEGILNGEEDGCKYAYTEPGRQGRIEAWLLEAAEVENPPEPGVGECRLLINPDGGLDSVCFLLGAGGGYCIDLVADGYSMDETLRFIEGISIR